MKVIKSMYIVTHGNNVESCVLALNISDAMDQMDKLGYKYYEVKTRSYEILN